MKQEQKSWIKRNYKKILIAVGVLTVILLLSTIGRDSYDSYIKDQWLQEQDSIFNVKLQNEIEQRLIREDANKQDEKLIVVDDYYQNKYYNERAKRIKAEMELDSIKYRVYSIKRLDSLAANITYE